MHVRRYGGILLALLLAGGILCAAGQSAADEAGVYRIDKERCARMLRYGLDALDRARYEDAKYYFQSAVQADPFNPRPWDLYDLAVFYSAADMMKKEGKFMARPQKPVETPQPMAEAPAPAETMAAPVTPPATPPAKPASKGGFKIADDEGC